MTGEVVNIGGSITGGSLKKSSILSERYELENVIKDIDVLDSEIKEIENKINEVDDNYTNLELEKNSIIISVNSNSEILKNKYNVLDDLTNEKSTLMTELSNNQNIVNNVITNEEEKILNEYYKEIEKRDELNIEINQIHKKIELENEDLINNESSLKNNNQEYNKAQEELKSHEIKVNRLDVKIDNLHLIYLQMIILFLMKKQKKNIP